MIHPKELLRLAQINLVLLRHGLDDIVLATHAFRGIRFLRYFFPWYWLADKTRPRAERIRRALEDLGPIFIKFGQALSTRRDLLPMDIADELARLQDRVAPFPGAQARKMIEQVYGCSVTELFAHFDETPLASASIAQVHAARLLDGTEVVVKVLRPGIRPMIVRDLRLLHAVARLAERYWQGGRRLRPREVVTEYEKTLFDELDLMREAANASQLRRNFSGSEMLYIPEVYWEHCRREVMVMERISGTPISDVEALQQQGVDLKKLSERGVEIFFTQVFRDNFFHADMHPGNIFVSPEGKYIAVDFGIMGTLSPSDQRYLAENFLAFFNRDYRKVAELHVQSAWVPRGTRIDEFESAIRSVCEPIFERPLKDISFGHLLLRLFQTARRFNMEVQPQLVLLQKTLLNIEGLGRQLHPTLDLWQTAKPFLERWMREQLGVGALLRQIKANAPFWAEIAPQFPKLVADILQQVHAGELQIKWRAPELKQITQDIRRAQQRMFGAIVGGALIVSAAVIVGLDGYSPHMWGNAPASAWILAGLGTLIVLFSWPDDSSS